MLSATSVRGEVMLVARASVGAQAILIETIADNVEVVGGTGRRQTEPTAIEDTLGEPYQRAREVITAIAANFSTIVKEMMASGQKIELEFSMGLSASAGLWVISGKGDAAIKVKMIWEKENG
jgi:hypothetical protein